MRLSRTSLACQMVIWAALALAVNGLPVMGQTVQWCKSIEQAKERAAAEKKPILLHFGSDDCGPCRNLEQFVFTDPRVAQSINESFVAVKIDTKQQAKLTQQFQVNRIPHDVVLTPDGQVAYRRMSPSSASAYVDMLKMGVNFAAQTSPRSQEVVAAMSGLVREQQDDRNRSPFYGDQAAQAGTTAAWPSNPRAVTPFDGTLPPANVRQTAATSPSEFANGNHLQRQAPSHTGPETNFPVAGYQPRTELPAISNPFTGSQPPMARPRNGQLPTSGQLPTLGQSDRSANAFYQETELPAAGLATRKVPTTIPNDHYVQQVTANVAPESAPIGLESYCPVTLLSSQKWVKGNQSVGCYHRGVLYLFADQAAMDRFLSAPDQWSPLLGGFDPVIMAQENRLQPGKRRFGVFCETVPGQPAIVLFANEANRDRFKQDSDRYLKMIRDVTAKADQE
ncbi:MAG: thioredoxin family protein [Pirellulaceae bacterium]|nr:thioredoxin family protein [Pirellulaceae bacterium]